MPNLQATRAVQKRSDAALESFHKYYAAIWGEERWHQSLFPSLSLPTRHCAVINRFTDAEEAEREVVSGTESTSAFASLQELQISSDLDAVRYPCVVQKQSGQSFPQPHQVAQSDGGQISSHWNMDLASVLAAAVLQARPGDRVLDLCASPGGKSIVLAQMLWPEGTAEPAANLAKSESLTSAKSCLHSNEPDQARHRRLATNLQSYLPSNLFADGSVKCLRISSSDKSAINELPLGKQGYSKILVDAPCSSERHIIHAHVKASSSGQVSQEMANWKSSHSKTLAKTQSALLMTAFRALKMGGRVVYATCSISTEENDDVVDRTFETLKRERKKVATTTNAFAWDIKLDTSYEDDPVIAVMLRDMTEKTKNGRISLPDHPSGGRWGPLYVAVMQKVPLESLVALKFQNSGILE